MKSAKRGRDYLKVLEHGEQVLCRNPWDMGTQMDMAEAFDALGLIDLAVFTLDQARQKYPKDATLNRALARLFEKRGDFQKAIVLWQLVKETHPTDVEAAHKAKDLAASETIQKGQYVEAASGTKESPVLGRIEARAVEKQDRLARDADPLLKRIEADPTEPALYVQLAGVYRRHGQPDRARAVLQQGLGPTGNAFQLQLRTDGPRPRAGPQEPRTSPRPGSASSRRSAQLGEDGTRTDDDDGGTQRDGVAPASRQAHQGDQRPRDRHLPREGGPLPDRTWPPHRTRHAAPEGRPRGRGHRRTPAGARDEKLKWKAAMLLGVCFKRRNNWRLAQRNFEEALAAVPADRRAGTKELLYQLASGCAENGDLPRAVDLGHELANLDFGFKNIGKLLDEWNDRMQSA